MFKTMFNHLICMLNDLSLIEIKIWGRTICITKMKFKLGGIWMLDLSVKIYEPYVSLLYVMHILVSVMK